VLLDQAFMFMIIYCPGISIPFQSNTHEPIKYTFYGGIAAAWLIVWGETRKYFIRRYPSSRFAKIFAF
jgi:hypothetical protein